MTSQAPDVDTYLSEVPEERRPTLEKLRGLCRRRLRGYEESMLCGLPTYSNKGAPVVSFASQKQYIALYVLKKEVVDEFRAAVPAASIGKGCIRFTPPGKIDFEIIDRLLRRAAESSAVPC
jgi:uncharacterized protein YdhG (YjbR/CyaY superfamily)